MTAPRHYYNENNPFAAAMLLNLIEAGELPAGDVDDRSIRDVTPADLRGYVQCHFFAGIGGWPLALRLAGWPEEKAIWTGSCPCQPFSNAGRGFGTADARHLWPAFFRLIRAQRPAVVVGEQVAGSAGYGWFDGVRSDLAGEDYASRGVDIPALAVDAPHIRSRLYWIALADSVGGRAHAGGPGEGAGSVRERAAGQAAGHDGGRAVADARGERPGRGSAQPGGHVGDGTAAGRGEGSGWTAGGHDGFWSGADWILCHDGKSRRGQPGVPLLVNGVRGRVALSDAIGQPAQDHLINRIGAWRGFGNAIVPQLAAEVIGALMDVRA